jgi:hypothetical protein
MPILSAVEFQEAADQSSTFLIINIDLKILSESSGFFFL